MAEHVTVPSDVVVEAAAVLLQAAELEMLTAATETPLSDAAEQAAFSLLAAAAGLPEKGEAAWKHPFTVEAFARAYERLADRVDDVDWRGKAEKVRSDQHALKEAFEPLKRLTA